MNCIGIEELESASTSCAPWGYPSFQMLYRIDHTRTSACMFGHRLSPSWKNHMHVLSSSGNVWENQRGQKISRYNVYSKFTWWNYLWIFMSTFDNQSMSIGCIDKLGHLFGFLWHHLLIHRQGYLGFILSVIHKKEVSRVYCECNTQDRDIRGVFWV